MNPKEAIQKIKQLFEESQVEVATKVEMSEYILKDGNKVEISSLEVGGDVVNVDGSPVADGEYYLADGTSMMVAGGKITEISAPSEVEVPTEEMNKVNEKVEEMQAEFQNKISSLKNENENLQKEINDLKGKMKEGFSQMISLVESISKVPSTEPIEKPSSFKFQESKDIKLERLNRYRNAILKTVNN